MEKYLTIQRRCLFCLVENNGGRICFDGRSQTASNVSENNLSQGNSNSQSIVECIRSTKGMTNGGVRMNSKIWARIKSDVHSDISTIFTMNSRAGCDIADEPSLRPDHLPVHHAKLVSSCLNSRDRKTAMKIFMTALCIAIIAIMPRTAEDASHSSKNHCRKIRILL